MYVMHMGRLEGSLEGGGSCNRLDNFSVFLFAFLPSGLIFSNLQATGLQCDTGPDKKAILNLRVAQSFSQFEVI
jgi:hypothetical protein